MRPIQYLVPSADVPQPRIETTWRIFFSPEVSIGRNGEHKRRKCESQTSQRMYVCTFVNSTLVVVHEILGHSNATSDRATAWHRCDGLSARNSGQYETDLWTDAPTSFDFCLHVLLPDDSSKFRNLIFFRILDSETPPLRKQRKINHKHLCCSVAPNVCNPCKPSLDCIRDSLLHMEHT